MEKRNENVGVASAAAAASVLVCKHSIWRLSVKTLTQYSVAKHSCHGCCSSVKIAGTPLYRGFTFGSLLSLALDHAPVKRSK